MEEILYSIALRKCRFVGDVVFRELINFFGSAKNVWMASHSVLNEMKGIGSKIIKEIGNENYLRFAEREIELCRQNGITILLRHRNEIPGFLSECDDAPSVLYRKGNEDKTAHFLSIVGTRNSTNYGKDFLESFFSSLKRNDVHVISGLAFGSDAEAHHKALQYNLKTSAVLAHGLHMIYPKEHSLLVKKILDSGGALFSEYNYLEKPYRESFLQRNRIVAGISPSLIVLESAYGGGSMSTVNFANQYNRDVYALPGRIGDKYSQGCNKIIAENRAKIIFSVKELISDLGYEQTQRIEEFFPMSKKINLTEMQNMVYQIILDGGELMLDEIAEKASVLPHKILSILLDLELLGCIKVNSARLYSVV